MGWGGVRVVADAAITSASRDSPLQVLTAFWPLHEVLGQKLKSPTPGIMKQQQR